MKLFQRLRMAVGGPLILFGVFMGDYLTSYGSSASADESQAAEQPAGDPQSDGIPLPTGKLITPTAASGAIFQDLNPGHQAAPDLRAGQAVAVSASPDGRILAILTSGFNVFFGADGKAVPELSMEYVFLFDITGPQPKQLQVLPLPNSFQGLAWAPSSDKFFASGGKDDAVLEFVLTGSTFGAGRTFQLGHTACVGLNLPSTPKYWGTSPISKGAPSRTCGPVAAGLAVSPDGTRLLVANIENDSVSLIDLSSGQVVAEQDLRPGIIDPKRRGQSGGSFPRSVAWMNPDHAYVASERDREIISLTISGANIHVVRRMPVHGQPVALLANRSGSRLYAALDTTNQVAIFDTADDALVEAVDATAPQSLYANTKKLGGANSNALALTPDERTLLVSDGGQNAVAVVRLSDRARGLVADHRKAPDHDDDDGGRADLERSAVTGLVPTGWYPNGVATSSDGATWYIVNFKHEPGSSAHWCQTPGPMNAACIPDNQTPDGWADLRAKNKNGAVSLSQNQLPWRLEKAGFLTMPAPAPRELARLTKQVAHNNHFDRPETAAADERLFSYLRAHIKHVIYIVKENKTYDEFFGDLEIGNGDPRLTMFPDRLTPNHHAIARSFTTLDNFLVSGAGSWTGWDWSASAQTNDFRERLEPLATATSMTSFKGESGLEGEPGVSRNLNMGYATSAERKTYDPLSPSDPDILPGARDVAAPDGPGGEEGKGYIWEAALGRGRTVRNWGFFGGFFRSADIPFVHDAYAQKLRVFFPTRTSLMPYSDPYYHSFDPAFPDYWRVQEWKREFAAFSATKSAPNLMLVQLANDHTGDFARAIDGVNTPDTQVADNDYALGLIIETVANSPFANDTLVISLEDDPLGGFDHVDAYRSVALFAGPYVRQHALVSTRYTTVSVVKTIEEILGLEPMGLNDALAAPMSDVFDPTLTTWSYKAIVPDVLRSTKLPLPASTRACSLAPRHSSQYWTKVMAGQDFSGPDRIDVPTFTRALWRGLKGEAPYPAGPTGADLRVSRAKLLAKTQSASSACRANLSVIDSSAGSK